MKSEEFIFHQHTSLYIILLHDGNILYITRDKVWWRVCHLWAHVQGYERPQPCYSGAEEVNAVASRSLVNAPQFNHQR